MFSYVMIGTNDLDGAKKFYDALLATLGTKPGFVDRHRIFWRNKGGTFSVTKPIDGKDASCANGGKACEDPPGLREGAGMKLYIAYLRDPCGNKICAVHRMAS